MPLTLSELEEIRADCFADDVEIEFEKMSAWNRERAQAWFEMGGVETAAYELTEMPVTIPRSLGGPPLHGKLLWPTGLERAPFGLLFCPSNPGLQFGQHHMESPVPEALANKLRSARIPLLRFNYSRVRGSGGSDDYDKLGAQFPPHGMEECSDASKFLKSRCTAIAVAGMSYGAAAMRGPSDTCAIRHADAIISMSTAPNIVKLMRDPVLKATAAQSMIKAFKEMKHGTPKLLLEGTKDRLGPKPEIDKLADAAPPPVEVQWLEGADHALDGFADAAADAVTVFLLKHFPSAAVPPALPA